MNYREVVDQMVPNGWRGLIPLTIKTGEKRPAVKWGDWQHEEQTLDDLRRLRRDFGHAPLTGIAFGAHPGGLVALDVDVEDEGTNALMRQVGGEVGFTSEFARVGKAPKFMAFFRGQVRSTKLQAEGGGVEVFGSSGQVAIFGTHPTTGRVYEWPGQSLLDHRLEDLPEVTQAQVDAFIAKAQPLLKERVIQRGGTWTDEADLRLTLKRGGVEAAQRVILALQEGGRHTTLLTVTGWLVTQGYDANQIATFADNNFPRHLRSGDWKDVRGRVGQMAQTAIDKWFPAEEAW